MLNLHHVQAHIGALPSGYHPCSPSWPAGVVVQEDAGGNWPAWRTAGTVYLRRDPDGVSCAACWVTPLSQTVLNGGSAVNMSDKPEVLDTLDPN